MTDRQYLKIKAQLYCGEEVAMGPGKADLLDAIAASGSISAAGRAMQMSYSRAWKLVDAMNRCFAEPLVETSPGSHSGGGAKLTGLGAQVLVDYRALQRQLGETAEGEALTSLHGSMLEAPRER